MLISEILNKSIIESKYKCRSNFQGYTGKSLSEALLFAELGENMLCTKIVLNVRNNFCKQHDLPRFKLGIFMHWTCNSMNKLSYCGLIDAKIRASDKVLPVLRKNVVLIDYSIVYNGLIPDNFKWAFIFRLSFSWDIDM